MEFMFPKKLGEDGKDDVNMMSIFDLETGTSDRKHGSLTHDKR